MLAADKSALQVELSRNILELQWKELEYLHMNFRSLSTSSAVLVGFGFFRAGYLGDAASSELYGPHSNVFSGTIVWDRWNIVAVTMEGIIGMTLSLAVSFNLITLFLSTITAMTGPGLALRGPEGSVGKAVKHMEKQNQRALRCFGRGLAFFCLHLTFLSVRALFGLGIIDGITGVLIGFFTLCTIFRYGSDIGERFHVSRDRAVRGSFTQDHEGVEHWNPHEDQTEQYRLPRWVVRWWVVRWRPPGHGRFTPLWRLDKLIIFPWHDDREAPSISGGASAGAPNAAQHRQQVEDVLLRMQGLATDDEHAGSSASSSFCRAHASAPGTSREGDGLPASEDLFDLLARKSVDFLTGRPKISPQTRLLEPTAQSPTAQSMTSSADSETGHQPSASDVELGGDKLSEI
jgi:hypothetical protein